MPPGDAMIYDAISELNELAGTSAARLEPQQRGLERLLLRLDSTALHDKFNVWRRAVVSLPLQDELFSTRKALDRAHGMLRNAVAAGRK